MSWFSVKLGMLVAIALPGTDYPGVEIFFQKLSQDDAVAYS